MNREEATPMSLGEVRSRATSGAVLLTMRSFAARAFGIVTTLLIAHYLGPSGAGTLAIGAALSYAFLFFTDGALGFALIRGAAPPSRADFASLMALQLAATVPAALVAFLVGPQFGVRGIAVAVMISGCPILALRTPNMIMFERALAYRLIARIEIFEAITGPVVTAVMILLGTGLVGVAAAGPATAIVGVVIALRNGPLGLVRPRWSWQRLRPIIGLGGRIQASGLASIARVQVLNFGTVAISGTRTLGLWTATYSVLLSPTVIFEPLLRVAYPAVARMLDGGTNPEAYIIRGIRVVTVVNGALMVGIVGAGRPGIALLFGSRFSGGASALPWAAMGLALATPTIACTSGYLFATDRAGDFLKAAFASAVVWVTIALALLPVIGVQAIGIGSAANSLVELAIISRSAFGKTTAVLEPSLGVFVATGIAGVAAWRAAGTSSGSFAHLALGVGVGLAAYIALVSLFARSDLTLTWRLARRARPGGRIRSDHA